MNWYVHDKGLQAAENSRVTMVMGLLLRKEEAWTIKLKEQRLNYQNPSKIITHITYEVQKFLSVTF